MPQLAVETFISQYIWLIVSLMAFYYLTIMYVIPQLSIIRKTRDLATK